MSHDLVCLYFFYFFMLACRLSLCLLSSDRSHVLSLSCFNLSYIKVLVGVFYFLKRCALLSKSMCLFVDYNHSRGPVFDDFLYKAPQLLFEGEHKINKIVSLLKS